MQIDELDAVDAQDSKAAFVEFYQRPKENPELTAKEGRPVHEMREYIRILVPGDKTLCVDRPVKASDKLQHRRQYKAFQEEKSQDEATGTLLKASGVVPEEVAEDYAHFKVKTVEQLASVSDSALGAMGAHARVYRDKAKQYLEAAKSKAPLLRLQKESEEKDARIQALTHQVAALNAKLEAMAEADAEKPKGKQKQA